MSGPIQRGDVSLFISLCNDIIENQEDEGENGQKLLQLFQKNTEMITGLSQNTFNQVEDLIGKINNANNISGLFKGKIEGVYKEVRAQREVVEKPSPMQQVVTQKTAGDYHNAILSHPNYLSTEN